ncbi:MAG: RNase P modulator RnpM [Lactovum sp.]
MVKQKKIPLRTSLASHQKFPKKELLRIVYNKEGEISIDSIGKAHGRGAYIALSIEEANLAKEKKIFNRAFSAEIPSSFYDELIDYVTYQVKRKELLGKVYQADMISDDE